MGISVTSDVKPLVPGRDLHIIACERATGASSRVTNDERPRRCIGVRWASRQDLGFPLKGYQVRRRLADADPGSPATDLATFWLPDTSSWAVFQADATARRPPCGPWFDDILVESHGYLVPLIRLVDPRTPAADTRSLVLSAADFFGDTHRESAELAWNFWRYSEPPTLTSLLDGDPLTAAALTAFYRARATELLLALALRFEYAVLLGLATDDWAPVADVVYEVVAVWRGRGTVTAVSDRTRTNAQCSPLPPKWLLAERAPGTLPHPAFQAWPAWSPPIELSPVDSDGAPLAPTALIPRYPAAFTALTWAPPPEETTLIGHGPVLYRAERYGHGTATAGLGSAPTLPAGAAFTAVGDGEDLIRPPHEPHYVDPGPGPWLEFEGFYHYQVRGVDLFGVPSVGVVRTAVRHHDDIAPATPRARINADLIVTLPAGATTLSIPVAVDWDAAEDFAGPDVTEFRIAASWIPALSLPVHLDAVTDVDVLHVDVTIAALGGTANAYVGGRLSTPGAEFPILSHGVGTPATMRVRTLGTRKPNAGVDALVISAGSPTPLTRIASLPRRPLVPATVSLVHGITPPEVTLAAASTTALPSDATVRAYVHVLRATLDAMLVAGARWRLQAPPAETPARETWDRWLALADPAAALLGSPVLLFPPHALTVTVTPPAGFTAGLLDLFVTAADDVEYVSGLALPVADPTLAAPTGNESARFEAFVSVRSEDPPETANVPAYDPYNRLWARSAANFAEGAQYQLNWGPAAGAVRYEVWRALEGAIPGATPALSDIDLRALVSSEAGGFELRSGQVFGTTYEDSLPGRAPTRALYRVRAISAAGVTGDFSSVIGPVYVPDVRRPPAPNLLRANAAPQAEADRAIAVEWTQAGPLDGVRFDVFFRDASNADAAWALAGRVAIGSTPTEAGRFRFLHLERPPGKKFAYYAVAVREALDPIDPAAVAKRDIGSGRSNEKTGSAISAGPLAAPVSLMASLSTQGVTLTWDNRDWYEKIEVRRKLASSYIYDLITIVDGDAESYDDTSVMAGTWRYQLRALGVRREARSAIDAEVTVR